MVNIIVILLYKYQPIWKKKNIIQIAYQKVSSTKQQQDTKGQQWSSGWKEIQLK